MVGVFLDLLSLTTKIDMESYYSERIGSVQFAPPLISFRRDKKMLGKRVNVFV